MEKNKQPILLTPEAPKSPMDLWKLMGGKAGRVGGVKQPPEDSLLAVYKDRLTYTFIFGREVASIHFDRARREIFFKGHNIRNLRLSEPQTFVLKEFKAVLEGDPKAAGFAEDYHATLGEVLADNC